MAGLPGRNFCNHVHKLLKVSMVNQMGLSNFVSQVAEFSVARQETHNYYTEILYRLTIAEHDTLQNATHQGHPALLKIQRTGLPPSWEVPQCSIHTCQTVTYSSYVASYTKYSHKNNITCFQIQRRTLKIF